MQWEEWGGENLWETALPPGVYNIPLGSKKGGGWGGVPGDVCTKEGSKRQPTPTIWNETRTARGSEQQSVRSHNAHYGKSLTFGCVSVISTTFFAFCLVLD